MRLKTNAIISAIFVALLAFVYFHEIKGGEERRAEAERAKQLARFGDHEVSRLVVDGGDTVVVVEKVGERWVVTRPVRTDADGDAIDRYLRSLRETEMERVIEDSAAVAGDPGMLAKYGLTEPRLRVLVELVSGPLDSMYFGSDTPTERYTYGQRSGANPQVFAARAWRFDNLEKGLFDLRDRRVVAFERDEVRQLRLERPGEAGTVVLSREAGGEWAMLEPLATAADQEAADGILSRLANAKAEEFAAEQPDAQALTGYGLDPDSAAIRLSLLVGEDRAEKRLTIGAETTEGRRYARDATRPPVFTIDSTLVKQLLKEVYDLRDRRPLRLDADAVSQISLSRPGEPDLIVRRDTADASLWRIVAPEEREARSWRITGLMADMDGIEVVAFERDGDAGATVSADYGLAEPRLAIAVESPQGQMRARFGTESDGEVFLSRGASVYRIAASTFDKLDLTLDDVAQPAAAPPADASGPAGAVTPAQVDSE